MPIRHGARVEWGEGFENFGKSGGHSAAVTCVHATGKLVLSGSDDFSLRVWRLADGAPVANLRKGHNSFVNAVDTTPEGRILSASHDKTVCVWEMGNDEPIHRLKGHTGAVTSVCATRDGHALSGSADMTVRVWDIVEGAPSEGRTFVSPFQRPYRKHVWKGHAGTVSSVHVTRCGEFALSGSWDRSVCVWSVSEGVLARTLVGHSGYVMSVHATPDSRTAVSGACDHSVRLWDLRTGVPLATLQGHEAAVNSVHACPDGLHVVSGSADGSLRLWSVEDGGLISTLPGQTEIRSVYVTPDGMHVLSGAEKGMLRICKLGQAALPQPTTFSVRASRWKTRPTALGLSSPHNTYGGGGGASHRPKAPLLYLRGIASSRTPVGSARQGSAPSTWRSEAPPSGRGQGAEAAGVFLA